MNRVMNNLYYLGRVLAFYGSINEHGISRLGVYYEKIKEYN